MYDNRNQFIPHSRNYEETGMSERLLDIVWENNELKKQTNKQNKTCIAVAVSCDRNVLDEADLKGKYHENFMSFQNPKMFVWQQKLKIIVKFCYKLSPQCNKTVD